MGGALSVGISVAVALELGACSVLKESVGIVVSEELTVEAHVRRMIAVGFVRDDCDNDSVNDEMLTALKVDISFCWARKTCIPHPAGILWLMMVRAVPWQICCSALVTFSWASFTMPVYFLQVRM